MAAERNAERRRRVVAVVRDAALITAASAVVALVVNTARSDGLPLVAEEEYQILVPCPEPLGEVEGLPPAEMTRSDEGTLVLDAREEAAFEAWHLPGARSVPFDFLESTPRAQIERIAGSGAQRVVVYGDGEDPDSGRELAREIAGQGIRNLWFVEGGAPALKAATEGGGQP